MRRSPRNLRFACDHRGLTHFGGIYFFHEFLQVLRIRRFLTQHLDYSRRNQRYSLSQMILALVYPLVLGLDRLETASFLRFNGTFQYLTIGGAEKKGPFWQSEKGQWCGYGMATGRRGGATRAVTMLSQAGLFSAR